MAFYVRAFGEGNPESFENTGSSEGFVRLKRAEKVIEEIDLQVTNTVMGSMSLQCVSEKGCTIDVYYSNWKKIPNEIRGVFADIDPDNINNSRIGGGMVFKMPDSIIVPPQSKLHKMISVPISRFVWVVVRNTDENEADNPTFGHILFV